MGHHHLDYRQNFDSHRLRTGDTLWLDDAAGFPFLRFCRCGPGQDGQRVRGILSLGRCGSHLLLHGLRLRPWVMAHSSQFGLGHWCLTCFGSYLGALLQVQNKNPRHVKAQGEGPVIRTFHHHTTSTNRRLTTCGFFTSKKLTGGRCQDVTVMNLQKINKRLLFIKNKQFF